jgi:GNAT superfamily N-acetyltransferase
MECVTEPDVGRFARRAMSLLQHDPVTNNVVLSLALAHADGQFPAQPENRWFEVTDRLALVGVAAWTPPRGPVLSMMDTAAAAALADHLAPADPPTVSGPVVVSDAFAERFCAITGGSCAIGLDLGVYRLGELTPPAGVPGTLREGGPGDRELVIEWLTAFAAEAIAHQSPADQAPIVDSRLRAGGQLWLWDVAGEPVCCVLQSAAVAGTVRLSHAYTPRSERGRGYGSAAVAATAATARARGARDVMLNANLANPTTNRIYQRMGFRRVGHAREWAFTTTGG